MILPLSDHKEFPEASGVYKVRDCSGQVIYIGKALDFKQRWKRGHAEVRVKTCKMVPEAIYRKTFGDLIFLSS